MSHESEIQSLESEWSAADGFFWKVRQGVFDPDDFQRALGKLTSMSFHDEEALPRRVVSLLWFIPIFLHWQIDRVREAGGDMAAYSKAVTMMTNEVERLLGVP